MGARRAAAASVRLAWFHSDFVPEGGVILQALVQCQGSFASLDLSFRTGFLVRNLRLGSTRFLASLRNDNSKLALRCQLIDHGKDLIKAGEAQYTLDGRCMDVAQGHFPTGASTPQQEVDQDSHPRAIDGRRGGEVDDKVGCAFLVEAIELRTPTRRTIGVNPFFGGDDNRATMVAGTTVLARFVHDWLARVMCLGTVANHSGESQWVARQ